MLMHLALYHLPTGARARVAAADIWPFFFEKCDKADNDGDGDDNDGDEISGYK